MSAASPFAPSVLVYDDTGEHADALREAIEGAGLSVPEVISSPIALIDQAAGNCPDVIIVHTDSPGRDVLEHLCVMTRDRPRPIVMFSGDDDVGTIRDATRAGVTAYVVDGLDPGRVRPILAAAIAQFDEMQRLRAELADVHLKLAERKVVEKAKGLLMQHHGLNEQQAYASLRAMAMKKNLRIGELARHVVDAAALLAQGA